MKNYFQAVKIYFHPMKISLPAHRPMPAPPQIRAGNRPEGRKTASKKIY